MAVFLLFQQTKLTLLIGNEYHLVEYHTLSTRNTVHKAQQVNRHRGVIDFDVSERSNERRKIDCINIYQGIDLRLAVTHGDLLVIDLEAGHRYGFSTEILREESVNEVRSLLAGKETGIDTGVTQLIMYLTDLDKEVPPFLGIIGHQPALFVFLCDGKIGGGISILTALEIAEVTLREKLVLIAIFIMKALSHKDILLVKRIAFTESLSNGHKETGEIIVAVNVGRELLHRILKAQHSAILTGLGIQHTHAVHFLHREVDVLEDFLSLATSSESIDRNGHTQTEGGEG